MKGEVSTRDVPLNRDVFVTPGILTVMSDLPPGTKQQMWSPISSTLIYGKRGAVPRRRPYHRRAGGRPGGLGRGERQEPDNDLCHPRPRRLFLWHRSASGPLMSRPPMRAFRSARITPGIQTCAAHNLGAIRARLYARNPRIEHFRSARQMAEPPPTSGWTWSATVSGRSVLSMGRRRLCGSSVRRVDFTHVLPRPSRRLAQRAGDVP